MGVKRPKQASGAAGDCAVAAEQSCPVLQHGSVTAWLHVALGMQE